MRTQFIVNEKDKLRRKEFYDYIVKKYDLENGYPYDRNNFINNSYPFVVDFREKRFWICESITCLACASQSERITTIDEFMLVK